MLDSLLIGLGIALGGVALLVGCTLFYSWRQDRKEAKRLREQSPKATLAPAPRRDHKQSTDHWNLTR